MQMHLLLPENVACNHQTFFAKPPPSEESQLCSEAASDVTTTPILPRKHTPSNTETEVPASRIVPLDHLFVAVLAPVPSWLRVYVSILVRASTATRKKKLRWVCIVRGPWLCLTFQYVY